MLAPRADLTSERLAEAERIFQALQLASEDEHWRIAQSLASKPDAQLLGATSSTRPGPRRSRPPSTGGKR